MKRWRFMWWYLPIFKKKCATESSQHSTFSSTGPLSHAWALKLVPCGTCCCQSATNCCCKCCREGGGHFAECRSNAARIVTGGPPDRDSMTADPTAQIGRRLGRRGGQWCTRAAGGRTFSATPVTIALYQEVRCHAVPDSTPSEIRVQHPSQSHFGIVETINWAGTRPRLLEISAPLSSQSLPVVNWWWCWP